MRYLLDKVTVRYTLGGALKLTEGSQPTPAELLALDFLRRAQIQPNPLFVVPQTDKLLQRLEQLPRYATLIGFFRSRIQVVEPARYFKRWSRRLRGHGFTSEDAAVLAIATFGTAPNADILGMDVVVTFDQPMINHWTVQHETLQKRLSNMRRHLVHPYRQASLPIVQHPEDILI